MKSRLAAPAAAFVFLVMTPFVLSQAASDAEKLLVRAQQKATAEGDLRGAIQLYEQVLTAKGVTRPLAVQALFGMAEAYEKRQLATDARAVYGRILREYPDAGRWLDEARTRLGALETQAQTTDQFPQREIDARLLADRAAPNTSPLEVSPDGRFLLMGKQAGSDAQPAFSLVMREIGGGWEQTLAVTGRKAPRQVGISPDGRWIAARVMERIDLEAGIDQDDLMILEVVPGASQPIILPWSSSSDFYARVNAGWLRLAWSPDSRWLPHLSPGSAPGRYDIRLFSVSSRASRSLGVETDGIPEFQWSPDASELGFHVTDTASGVDEIQIVNVVSNARRTVALPAASGIRTVFSAWTAKGDLVLRRFSANPKIPFAAQPAADRPADVVLLSLERENVRTICSSPWRLQVVPWTAPLSGPSDLCLDVTADGATLLVWNHRSQRIVLRDTTSLADRPLTTGSGVEQFANLSPDGRIVLVSSNRDGRWGWYAALVGPSPDPDPAFLASAGNVPDLELRWTRESIVARWSEHSSDIYRVNVDPRMGRSVSALERLTQETGPAYTPAISPDSARIAYWASSMGQYGIATMDADGANERVLTVEPMEPFRWPYWRSPHDIVFAQRLHSRLTQPKAGTMLRRWHSLTVASRAVTPLPMGALETDPLMERASEPVTFLAPTGELVYGVVNPMDGRPPNTSTTRDVHTLRARSLSDGTDRVLATIAAPSTTLLGMLASPDGKRIAYLLRVDTPKGAWEGELGVVSVVDSGRRTLVKFAIPSTPAVQPPKAWSPDGKFLLYSHNAQPRVINVETLEHWRLIEDAHQPDASSGLARSLRQWGAGGEASWSPDGSFIALTMESGANYARQWSNVTAAALEKRRSSRKEGR